MLRSSEIQVKQPEGIFGGRGGRRMADQDPEEHQKGKRAA